MNKRSEESKSRLKRLFILLILTCILAILSTYAWFTAQNNVELTGLNVNVETERNMQISLDGETWARKIEITSMDQIIGTGADMDQYRYKAPAKNKNYVPSALLPVSTVGKAQNGVLQFVRGKINGNKLENITQCKEDNLTEATHSEHPYLVFDMYLMNMSDKQDTLENVLLDQGSAVWGLKNIGGLAGSARVGFVAYNTNTADLTATPDTIRALEGGKNDLVAIWEPNYNKHVKYVVDNDSRINSANHDFNTLGIDFDKLSGNTSIDNVMANNTTGEATLVDVKTNKIAEVQRESAADVYETGAATELTCTDSKSSKFAIARNKITKVRVYIWLEGQDPDCIDYATQDEVLNVDMKFTKNDL